MTIRSTTHAISALAASLAFAAGAAFAQSQDDAFRVLDTDGSGGVSLEELQAAGANVSEESFALYDTDGSGELSADEYAAWTSGETPGQ